MHNQSLGNNSKAGEQLEAAKGQTKAEYATTF